MAQPNPYAKATDFAEYQTAHQSAPFNGALLDAELVDIQTNLTGLNTNIGLIQRDDGALANSVVTIESLADTTLALIASPSFSVEGAWLTGTVYALGDVVEESSIAYLCVAAHTSGTFATDFAASKWVSFSVSNTPPDNIFKILGSGDDTKIARFEVDGFTTATTNVFTLPNATCTLAAIEVAQTWTANQVFGADVTLGDASGDTLTINAGTWTIGSSYTATRAAGTISAGNQTLAEWNTTFTGDSGGTTDVKVAAFNTTSAGANAIAAIYAKRIVATHGGSATATDVYANNSNVVISSTGNATNIHGYMSRFTISSSGNVTNARNFLASAATLSSTGAITNVFGYQCGDLGHATLVTNSIGFSASDMTASLSLTAGFRGQLSAGTGKYNLYMDGTAQNYLAGRLGIGTTSLITTTLALGANISGGTSASVVHADGVIQSGVIATGAYFQTSARTAAASFTLGALNHFRASQGEFGSGSTVSFQAGFFADSNLIGGTNNFGFWGDLSAGSGRYNLYMSGTAQNYLAGATGIGTAAVSTSRLTLAASTAGVSSMNLPHGSAPSSPVDGDVWTTTAGIYVRVNGSTVGPLT